MKTGILALALVAESEPINNRVARSDSDDLRFQDEKRYFQLTDMMGHYNPDFDERKYWTYGCNCLILGDRPMSDPGHGPPVDALDVVCKAYKDCQQCAKAEYGEQCIGEFVKYKYGEKNGDKYCKDNQSACGRSLCECDLAFAKAHVAKAHVFNKDKHLFWSTLPGGWEPKENCPRGGGGPYDPQCCRMDVTTPFLLYNKANHECCPDGSVAKQGQC